MLRHLVSVLLILLVVTLVYARVTGAYYCGYDDFFEAHRAAFEDAKDPSRIFTTTHFGTPKYRPLSRTLSFTSYWAGHGDPIGYRLRNLIFHLLSVAAVYGLGWLLFHSWDAALAAALLFGLHPLANQSVVAASFNNPAANFFFLACFFFFIYSLQAKRRTFLWLGLALACAFPAVFIYEASVVVFVLLYAYLAIAWLRTPQAFDRRFLFVLTGGVAFISALFAGARLFAVHNSMPRTPPALLVKNSAMYAGALLLPFDSVLAHHLLGTPLPSQFHLDLRNPAIWIALLAAVVVVFAVALWLRERQADGMRLDWPILLLLAAAGPIAISPFLLFNPHPSETYLPLPAAFFLLAACAVLRQLIQHRWKYLAVISAFAALFGSATWVRNELVTACGNIAERIFREMPTTNWSRGEWLIRVAYAPGQQELPRYGMYSYHGLSTISPLDPMLELRGRPLECGLQTVAHNEELQAAVIPAAAMPDPCPREGTCFWVYDDGHVSPADTRSASK